MAKTVIDPKRKAAMFPLLDTLFLYVSLDHLNPPGWVWGVIGTVWLFILCGCFYGMLTQQYRDPFPGAD